MASNTKPKLYYTPMSYYSQKVVLALDEKQVPYDEVHLDLLNCENYAHWYMKLNPKGQIPLLQHDNNYITESAAIIKYIDNRFDGPPLIPEEHESEINEMVSILDSIDIPVLTFGSVLNKDLTKDSQLPAIIQYFMKRKINSASHILEEYEGQIKHDSDLRHAYETKSDNYFLNPDKLGRERVLECLGHAATVFDELEKKLEKNSQDPAMRDAWLVNRSFTAADIALAVCLQRLTVVGFTGTLLSSHPFIAGYRQRLYLEKPNFVKLCVKMNIRRIVMDQILVQTVKVLPVFLGIAVVGIGVYYMKNK